MIDAIYCMQLRELLLDHNRCVPVPKHIADTVSEDQVDFRYVKNWAVQQKLLSQYAEIGLVA
ncbi:hypothetical protein [Pseudomonas brenneri]|jgi:hypothetical protein|uniref:hypothetical protein n=1 Tax=Pseudomonas brenneri TaxID=129817 RepID=UPI003B9EEB0C